MKRKSDGDLPESPDRKRQKSAGLVDRDRPHVVLSDTEQLGAGASPAGGARHASQGEAGLPVQLQLSPGGPAQQQIKQEHLTAVEDSAHAAAAGAVRQVNEVNAPSCSTSAIDLCSSDNELDGAAAEPEVASQPQHRTDLLADAGGTMQVLQQVLAPAQGGNASRGFTANSPTDALPASCSRPAQQAPGELLTSAGAASNTPWPQQELLQPNAAGLVAPAPVQQACPPHRPLEPALPPSCHVLPSQLEAAALSAAAWVAGDSAANAAAAAVPQGPNANNTPVQLQQQQDSTSGPPPKPHKAAPPGSSNFGSGLQKLLKLRFKASPAGSISHDKGAREGHALQRYRQLTSPAAAAAPRDPAACNAPMQLQHQATAGSLQGPRGSSSWQQQPRLELAAAAQAAFQRAE